MINVTAAINNKKRQHQRSWKVVINNLVPRRLRNPLSHS